VWLTQSSLDALITIIHYFEGVAGAGKGQVSGSHELIMFYRTIVSSLEDACKESDKVNNRVANLEEQKKKVNTLLNDFAETWENRESYNDMVRWLEHNFDALCVAIGRRKEESDEDEQID